MADPQPGFAGLDLVCQVTMKISFIGAGQVGGQAAFLAASSGLGDVVLFDTRPGIAAGKALDIGQSLAVMPGSGDVAGGDDWEMTAQSDVLVVTAGLARKPGMSRQDLLSVNAAIVCDVVGHALRHSPEAVVIIVTNPINTMTYLGHRVSGLPAGRVLGMAGVLDNARLRYFIARGLSVSISAVESWVIGDHGDRMVPVISKATVSGVALRAVASAERIEEMCRRARNAGTEILGHLREGSAYFAPGAAVCRMLEAIRGEASEGVVTCSAMLEGHYGFEGLFAGVPAVLGRGGVERIVEFDLEADERLMFESAIAGIRERNTLAEQLLAHAVL